MSRYRDKVAVVTGAAEGIQSISKPFTYALALVDRGEVSAAFNDFLNA